MVQVAVQRLLEYLSFPFVRNAIVTGILISLCAALIGVPLVLRRFAFIGASLSHTAFSALAVASVLRISNGMFVVLPFTILFSILIFYASSKRKQSSEAAVALVSSGALGIGYLVMNVFSKKANLSGDVCTILFGSVSILTLKKSEVMLTIVLSLLVIALFFVFYNKIFQCTFDRDFSCATGTNVFVFDISVSVLIAVIIVLSMNLVGSLLISALLIFPPLASMRLFKSFRAVVISSCALSVVCSVLGLLIAVLAGTPVGSTIVFADIVVYLICFAVGSFASCHKS